MDVRVTHEVPRRRLLTVTGVAGTAYTLSWIAGLAIAAPNPKLTASGAQITTALAGHETAVVAQFALTEGLPAAGLAIVSVALARAARRSGAVAAARAALIAGVAAALISLLQFVLGVALVKTASPGTAHLLYGAVNRLDGVKMFALAVLGLAGAAAGVLPRWLRYTGIALAVAIAASGVAYLLLLPGLAVLAAPARVLLLALHHRHRHRARRKQHCSAATPAHTTGMPARTGWRARALAVLGAATAALTVWAVAGPLAGVDLRVRLGSAAVQHVGPATVAIVSILAGLAAWALLAVLEGFTARARTVWIAVVLVTLALSLAGPLSGGVTMAAKVALACMHLATAAVLILLLAGGWSRMTRMSRSPSTASAQPAAVSWQEGLPGGGHPAEDLSGR